MSTITKRDELQKQLTDIRDQISDLDAEDRREQNSKHVGRCYATANRYSVGAEWPRYSKVLSLDEDSHLVLLSFEKSPDDMYTFAVRETRHRIGGEYSQVSDEWFNQEFAKMLNELAKLVGAHC